MTEYKWDAFLSHSSKDKPIVRDLKKRLEAAGVRCYLDEDQLGPGDNVSRALEAAVETSRHLVLVLSPTSVDSEWVELEWTMKAWDSPANRSGVVVPIRIKGVSLEQIPKRLRILHVPDCSTPEGMNKVFPGLVAKLGGQLTADQEDSIFQDRGSLPPVGPLPGRSYLPHQSLGPDFVGRTADLWSLHDALEAGRRAAVTGRVAAQGIGGVGKTMLAVEYARRFGPRYYGGGVHWFQADGEPMDAFRKVATALRLDLPKEATWEEIRLKVDRALRDFPEPALWIVDNLDTANWSLWVPADPRARVLFTTRRTDLARLPAVNVVPLEPDPGLELLTAGRALPEEPVEQGAARSIVHRLGGLPLALELAAHYLEQTRTSYADYLGDLSRSGPVPVLKHSRSFYAGDLPTGHEKDIVRSFEISVDKLPKDARRVLAAAALFAPEGISEGMLRQVAGLPESEGPGDLFAEHLARACGLSLIQRTKATLALHRLIRAYVTEVSNDWEVLPALRATFFETLSRTLFSVWNDDIKLRDSAFLIPHAEEAARQAEDQDKVEALEALATPITAFHRVMGGTAKALIWGKRAAKAAESLAERGGDQASLSRALSGLATVYKDFGDAPRARDLLERALKIAEEAWGPDHPTVGTSLSNLALVYKDLGDAPRARDLLERALRVDSEARGPTHPHVAIDLDLLANVLCELGEAEKATEMDTRARAIRSMRASESQD